MVRFCFAALFLSAMPAPAAFAADVKNCPEQTAPVDALIDRASAIVIAEPVADSAFKAEPGIDLRGIQDRARDATAQPAAEDRMKTQLPIQLFTVADYVKGEGPSEISITTAFPVSEIRHEGPAHNDPAFWEAASGRGALTENCGVAAAFLPGTRYLLFVGAPHVKSYEAVTSDSDPWLAYVRERVSERP